MKRFLYLLFVFCAIPSMLLAQSYQITGQVTDAGDGSALIGVTVQTQTKVGTITDIDGNYSIKANKGDILTFFYIGMETQTVKVESEKVINVVMTERNQLDEVVVIGYGSVKKRDLSGSVSQVKADDLLRGNPSSSINQALQGRMAGVVVNQNDGAPGAGISIMVRGTNSFSTNSQPLYIVDGIPFDVASNPRSSLQNDNNQTTNALANINPHDIESIEVLKDASATAIYGSRGANGVVLITTKKGKMGRSRIELTTNFGVSHTAKRVKVLDAFTFANYRNEQAVNSERFNGIPIYNLPYPGKWSYQLDVDGNPIYASGVYEPSPEDFLNQGVRTDEHGNVALVESTDWLDEIFQTATSQEYNLSISGANEQGSYAISGNFMDQTGIIRNSGYKRYAIRANIVRKLSTWLEIGLNTNYTNSLTKLAKTNSSGSGLINSALRFPPTISKTISNDALVGEDWRAFNPYAYVNNAQDELKTNSIFNSAYAQFKITDYLQFKQNLGLSYSNNDRYTYYNRLTGEGKAPTNGKGALADNWYQSIVAESLLTFDKTFNIAHSINVVAAFTYEQGNYGHKTMSASNFPNDITGAYDMSTALTVDPLDTGRGRTGLVSILSRANYSYNSKYIATASFRRDGSSKFIAGNKFANFYSGALAWRLSEENFIKSLNFFDNLKLRLSYGQTGNQGIGAYQTQAYLGTANYPIGGSQASGFAELEWRGALNSNLKWETTDQYNAGLDMSILKGRVSLTVDAYYKKTRDLLQPLKIEPNSGFPTMWSNFGWVENLGLEFAGKFYAFNTKNFGWDIDANISFNKNTIGGLNGDQFASRLWSSVDQVFIQRNGAPIGAIYGYVEDGFYDNVAEVRADPQFATQEQLSDAMAKAKVGEIKYRDIDGDGAITSADRVIIGDVNPDFTFGITSNFRWKNFTASFFLQGMVGNDIFNANLMDVTMVGNENIPQYVYDSRWTEDNKANARWPKAIIGGYTREWKISDRYVEDGSYLRLKNLNIGYNFNPRIKGIERINIFASATNLLTITGYDWFDPDVNAFGGDASRRGVDLSSYPSSRTYSLGLKIDF